MPGYWLVQWRTGRDVRAQGSGGTGATNTGRALGRGGFFSVLLLDSLKGALAVGVAVWQQQPAAWVCATVVAVIAGHVWPLQLGFRGGRGIATLLGAWLVFAPWALLPCALLTLVVLALVRRFTFAGLVGLSILPAATWWATGGLRPAVVASGVVLAVVFYAHHDHLRRWLNPGTATG